MFLLACGDAPGSPVAELPEICPAVIDATPASPSPDVSIDVAVRDAGQFPVIAKAGSSLFAVFRGRGEHVSVDGRLDLARSTDSGRTWTQRVVVADGPLDDRNPALGVAPNGDLLLAYGVFDSYDSNGAFQPSAATRLTSYVTRSRDQGLTWDTPRALDIRPFEWSSPYGKIVALGDELVLGMYGGWLPVYDHSAKPEEKKGFFAFVMRSRDGGASWGPAELIGPDSSEPGLLALPPDEMLAVLRGYRAGDLVLKRWTRRRGSWSVGCAITVPGEHPGDLVMLPNGEILLTYGERALEPYGARARRSRDLGRTWSAPFVVATVPGGGDLGYPSVAVVGDSVVTLYYAQTVGADGISRRALYSARYRW